MLNKRISDTVCIYTITLCTLEHGDSRETFNCNTSDDRLTCSWAAAENWQVNDVSSQRRWYYLRVYGAVVDCYACLGGTLWVAVWRQNIEWLCFKPVSVSLLEILVFYGSFHLWTSSGNYCKYIHSFSWGYSATVIYCRGWVGLHIKCHANNPCIKMKSSQK